MRLSFIASCIATKNINEAFLSFICPSKQQKKKKKVLLCSFMHHNSKTKKLARFSFLLSHIIPTKQKKPMKQDLSFFLAFQQQNRKINEVFLHPIIVTKKRKRNSFLFHSKILKNFFVPLHVAITKQNSTSLFYLAKENNHEKHEKKIVTWLLVLITKITSLLE